MIFKRVLPFTTLYHFLQNPDDRYFCQSLIELFKSLRIETAFFRNEIDRWMLKENENPQVRSVTINSLVN